MTGISDVPKTNTDSYSNPMFKQFGGIDLTAAAPVVPPFLRGNTKEEEWRSVKTKEVGTGEYETKDGKEIEIMEEVALPVKDWVYRVYTNNLDNPERDIKIFKLNKKGGIAGVNYDQLGIINNYKSQKNQ